MFNVAAFLAGLSLLERSAALFVASATALAKRLKLPEILVGILIAGAEWEELAVVGLSLAQQRPALAVGNIIGSAIANILGAFALGLVFSPQAAAGGGEDWAGSDAGAQKACVGLLALTSLVALFALADILWNRVVAALLVLAFGAYLAFVLWTIWRELFYTGHDEDADDFAECGGATLASDYLDDASSSSYTSAPSSADAENEAAAAAAAGAAGETTPLFAKPTAARLRRRLRHTVVPLLLLLLQVLGGFAGLTLSGFLLAQTSARLAAAFALSDAAFGATVLALATTLPEKFVAVASSTRGHTALLVADAVGSNVFLLTLCLGVTAWAVAAHGWHDPAADGRPRLVDVARIEAWWLWAAAVALVVVVGIGSTGVFRVAGVRQVLGALMLVGYGGFVAVELTVLRH